MAQEAMQLSFADGVYTFKLTLNGIKEIQDKTGGGIGAVWQRLAASRLNFIGEDIGIPSEAKFKIQDIIEPIRQGLIGGKSGIVDGEEVKVTAHTANTLIERYIEEEPLQVGWSLAYAIVGGLVEGYSPPEDEKTKPKPKKKVTRQKRTPKDTSTT